MVRFHYVYEKMNSALEGMPYDQLGISEEVKEQVGPSRFLLLYQILLFFFHFAQNYYYASH